MVEELRAEENAFRGVVVDGGSICRDPEDFRKQLHAAIATWKSEGVKVVWLDVVVSLASHIPVAVDLGFGFHHAREDCITMTLRLLDGAFIPPPATHYVGAGGVVISENDDLLVVAERYGRRSGRRHLKLPGGALRPGEHIVDAVRREIREETGIETRFRSLSCFRHWHGYRHGKSDIYFVCRLDPLTFDLVCQESEIEECLWMPLAEYLEHPDVHLFNRSIVRAALTPGGFVPDHIEGYGTPETHELFMPSEKKQN